MPFQKAKGNSKVKLFLESLQQPASLLKTNSLIFGL